MVGMNARSSRIDEASDLEPVPAGARFAHCLRDACEASAAARQDASVSLRALSSSGASNIEYWDSCVESPASVIHTRARKLVSVNFYFELLYERALRM